MLVIPAVDMQDRKVVRLRQGRREEAVVYSDSIRETANAWIAQGAKRLHIVDLNGAFGGKPYHFDEVAALADAHPDVEIQVGGGIRELDTIKKYLEAGVSYCIIGTAAVSSPSFVLNACKSFPGKIILSLDTRQGLMATDGWDRQTKVHVTDLVFLYKDCAIESLIYTDIAKDGMLTGMNFLDIQAIRDAGFRVIAAGGLTRLEDIDRLVDAGGVHGVIAGKALYENRFSLSEAIARAGGG